MFIVNFRKTVDKVDTEFVKILQARESVGVNPFEYANGVDWELGGLMRVQSTEFVNWKTDELEGLFEDVIEYDDDLGKVQEMITCKLEVI